MSALASEIKTADWKSEKHVPTIDCPDTFAPDQPLDVLVQVGKEIRHPNTSEHFINWIELYFKPEGSSNLICLGRADFSSHGESTLGPNQGFAYTEPVLQAKSF